MVLIGICYQYFYRAVARRALIRLYDMVVKIATIWKYGKSADRATALYVCFHDTELMVKSHTHLKC